MAGKTSGKTSRKASRKPYRVGRSPTGLGLFATETIEKGAFIVEYKGAPHHQCAGQAARGTRQPLHVRDQQPLHRGRLEPPQGPGAPNQSLYSAIYSVTRIGGGKEPDEKTV